MITTIILFFAGIITLGVLCLETAYGNIDVSGLDNIQNPEILEAIAYISFGFAGICFIVLLCSFRKIKIGIMVLKTTALFTEEECQTLLVPVFMFISIVQFFVCRLCSLPSGSQFLSLYLALEPFLSVMVRRMLVLTGITVSREVSDFISSGCFGTVKWRLACANSLLPLLLLIGTFHISITRRHRLLFAKVSAEDCFIISVPLPLEL